MLLLFEQWWSSCCAVRRHGTSNDREWCHCYCPMYGGDGAAVAVAAVDSFQTVLTPPPPSLPHPLASSAAGGRTSIDLYHRRGWQRSSVVEVAGTIIITPRRSLCVLLIGLIVLLLLLRLFSVPARPFIICMSVCPSLSVMKAVARRFRAATTCCRSYSCCYCSSTRQ